MKNLVSTASLILLSLLMYSQDYRNICSKGVTLYHDPQGSIEGFRYDSLQVTSGHDSVFTAFPAIIFSSSTGIADSAGGTILGRKIIRKNDGRFIFFNKDGDTIFLDTTSRLNYMWKFFSLPGNGYIGARITSIILDTITGAEDSVKVIRLQAYDSQSNPLSHPFNGKFLKLSKHYGLTLTYNFWTFPSLSSSYEICGKTSPEMGVRPLRMIDVYNYDIGDEFHYHVVSQNYDYHGNHFDYRYIVKVLSKSMAGDNSGVTYKFSICCSYSYSLFPAGGGSGSSSFDQTVSYDFKALEDKYCFNKLPGEFFCYTTWDDGTGLANIFSSRIMSYSTLPRVQNKINDMVYARNSATGGQWVLLSTAFPQAYVDKWYTFTEGLGLTHRFDHETWGSISDSTLVYFKKANETSGNPIASGCSALMGNQELSPGPVKIAINPNPFATEADVILSGIYPGTDYWLVIFDFTCREVRRTKVTDFSFSFSRAGLSGGLYLAVLFEGKGDLVSKTRFVIF